MKILFIGDIVGRVGRNGVRKILPQLKEQYQPDVVIANAENIAHGVGIDSEGIEAQCFSNAKKVRREGTTVVVEVPSRTRKHSRYKLYPRSVWKWN